MRFDELLDMGWVRGYGVSSWLSDVPTSLVRGLSNKEMNFQNKGAVPVQIAPLLFSQPRN